MIYHLSPTATTKGFNFYRSFKLYENGKKFTVAQKLQVIDCCGNTSIHWLVSLKVSVISLNIRHRVIRLSAIHLFVHIKSNADHKIIDSQENNEKLTKQKYKYSLTKCNVSEILRNWFLSGCFYKDAFGVIWFGRSKTGIRCNQDTRHNNSDYLRLRFDKISLQLYNVWKNCSFLLLHIVKFSRFTNSF